MAEYPHCDSRVVHAPSKCQYCDMHPELQQERIDKGINFTGEEDSNKLPCPADADRPKGSPSDHRRWGGNVAKPAGAKVIGYDPFYEVTDKDPRVTGELQKDTEEYKKRQKWLRRMWRKIWGPIA